MNINGNISINTQAVQQVAPSNKLEKAVKKAEIQNNINSAEAKLSDAKIRSDKEIEDIINENILSASSSFMDISKAEDMIRKANMNILNNSGDAVMSQSKQSASMAMELLK